MEMFIAPFINPCPIGFDWGVRAFCLASAASRANMDMCIAPFINPCPTDELNDDI